MSVIVHSKDTADAPREGPSEMPSDRWRDHAFASYPPGTPSPPSDHSGVGARQATGWRARESLRLRQTSLFAASDRRIRKGVADGFSPVLAM